MSELVENARRNLALIGFPAPRKVLVVGVSGGLDSMVLLQVLHRLTAEHGGHLTVAHYNHQLRGEESDQDEAFVRETAARLGLPLVTERGAVRQYAARQKLSEEMAARQLRHAFLARAARRRRARFVALAHHADDQLETFLLRVLRGAGSEGLSGMKLAGPSPVDERVTLVRPLLTVPRCEICDYAQAEGVSFREDSSNQDMNYLRNRVRHQLVPLLRERLQPAARTAVLRSMELIGAEADFVGQAGRAWLKEETPAPFETLHVAVQRRVIQLQLMGLKVAPTYELVECLRQKAGEPFSIGPGMRVRRETSGQVRIEKVTKPAFDSREQTLRLTGSQGETEFSGVSVWWRLRPVPPRSNCRPAPDAAREFFDADKIGPLICLRHWRSGDRFRPIGSEHAVKLQDLFTNQRIPRGRRHELLVAAKADGETFWVEGLRIGDNCKLDEQTRCCLEWRWQRCAGQS